MVRRARLHEHATALRAAPRPPRNLRHELKRPLASPKVGKVQPRVGIHDSDDRDVRKVEPLGDHLGSEQDVDLALGNALQDVMVRPLARRRVEIHACDSRAGIAHPEEMLELLRTQTAQALGLVTADQAGTRYSVFVAAVVAAHRGRSLMHRESDGAPGTSRHVAARRTLHERRKSAAVEQQNHLFAAF